MVETAQARLVRIIDNRGIGARFALSVRELTPIHEISEDSRPYSILGQRFMTTLRPAASAFAAAASSRAPSCIQIIFGVGVMVHFKKSITSLRGSERRSKPSFLLRIAGLLRCARRFLVTRLLPILPFRLALLDEGADA